MSRCRKYVNFHHWLQITGLAYQWAFHWLKYRHKTVVHLQADNLLMYNHWGPFLWNYSNSDYCHCTWICGPSWTRLKNQVTVPLSMNSFSVSITLQNPGISWKQTFTQTLLISCPEPMLKLNVSTIPAGSLKYFKEIKLLYDSTLMQCANSRCPHLLEFIFYQWTPTWSCTSVPSLELNNPNFPTTRKGSISQIKFKCEWSGCGANANIV